MTIKTRAIDCDIAARHAQVVGEGPRIAPLPQSEMDQASHELCVAVREGVGVTEHSKMPGYMLTMIKNPGIFAPHMQMGEAIFRGTIPPRERELAVLRVAWLSQAPYEWGQHVAIAQRYGVLSAEIERVTLGSSAADWSTHDAAILRGVEELLGDQTISDATWAILAQSWNEAQLIEFPMMVGQYVATAFVQNTLRIALVAGNPGLSAR